MRDLLGLTVDSTQFLPADDSARGFDNQAAALTLSPALLEAYLAAAARIARRAVGTDTSPEQATYRVAEDANQNYRMPGLPFGTRGGLAVDHEFPADGDYVLKVFSVNLGNMGNFRPFGEITGEQLLVYVDDAPFARIDWDKALAVKRSLDEDAYGQLKTIDVPLPMRGGTHRVTVTFAATNYAPGLDLNHAFERSTIETGGIPGFTFYPHIGSIRIDGPAHGKPAADTDSRRRIFTCHPVSPAAEAACARQIAVTLARRAFRGRVNDGQLDSLLQIYAATRKQGSFDEGIEAVVQRVLSDPQFLFRLEAPPPPGVGDQPYALDGLDLASRLSFFLWSSLPDDQLLDLAQAGKLQQDDILRAQVRRMLADPRAAAFISNFAGQWLALRDLASHSPVVDQFPDFDDNLRQAFRRETELLFASLITEDRSVLDLLTADYTFLNERLARHYGIPDIRGAEFRRVQLTADQSERFGLLGKGAMLMVSSQPGRTSPVIRGNWVLKKLLGVPAPDPPPNVPTLPARSADAAGNTHVPTMREQLEQHRKDPACRGCHQLMDPIGFALEPFDAVGRWRAADPGVNINARAVMYDGTTVEGPAGVRAFLLRYRDQYLRNFAQNLMTYALGRGMEYVDMPAVRAVVHASETDDYRLGSMIEAVVLSDLFRMNVAGTDDEPVQQLSQAR